MKLRLNVAGILRNAKGEILIGERVDVKGAWQFPQGGVEDGESHEDALLRELNEEISVRAINCKILQKQGPYFYYFNKPTRGHDGKEQYFFLVEYSGDGADLSVETEHPEFRALKWIQPDKFKAKWLPEMKLGVYRGVMRDFFQVKI